MDNNKNFLRRARSVSYLNAEHLRERLDVGHHLLLTEIVASKIKGKSLPNVKWLQTELQISFTKVKSIIESLESRGLITKISDPNDKRRKFLDVTNKGHKYINDFGREFFLSYMDNNKNFLRHARSVSYLNAVRLRERLDVGHFLLLTEIVASKIKGKSLPNVKWLQTELQISFTKVKSIIESLESRGLITKISDPNDKRRKFLDVTNKGHKYICNLNESIYALGNKVI